MRVPTVVGVAVLAVVIGVGWSEGSSARATNEAGLLTYEQAVAAGLDIPRYDATRDPASSEYESRAGVLPYCTSAQDSGDGGYPTAEALDAAVVAASPDPVCQENPRSALYTPVKSGTASDFLSLVGPSSLHR